MMHRYGPRVRGNKIHRRAYNRKGYIRHSYVKQNGTKVKSVRIHPVHVAAEWIKKQGRTVGKYGEIPIKDDKKLKSVGYHLSKPQQERHNAIKKAMFVYGRNWILHKINAIRNILPKTPKYSTYRRRAKNDIEFIEVYYPSMTELRRRKRLKYGGRVTKRKISKKTAIRKRKTNVRHKKTNKNRRKKGRGENGCPCSK